MIHSCATNCQDFKSCIYTCDKVHWSVWYDSLVCNQLAGSLVFFWDSHVWQSSLIWLTCLIHVNPTGSISVSHVFTCTHNFIDLCGMTHACATNWQDGWFFFFEIHTCGNIHWSVWHDWRGWWQSSSVSVFVSKFSFLKFTHVAKFIDLCAMIDPCKSNWQYCCNWFIYMCWQIQWSVWYGLCATTGQNCELCVQHDKSKFPGDMTHVCVWHDSSIREHDLFICVTWCIQDCECPPHDTPRCIHMRDMTHPPHDSPQCMYTCDMTHPPHNPPRFIHMCDMTYPPHDPPQCMDPPQCIHMCDMTHSPHDSRHNAWRETMHCGESRAGNDSRTTLSTMHHTIHIYCCRNTLQQCVVARVVRGMTLATMHCGG